MLGIIITGHGKFSEGIKSALELISGPQEDFSYVNFTASDTKESLMERLEKELDQLAHCKGIVIFTDLAGGTPFNVSAELKYTREEKIEVVAGSNLPMVLEICMGRLSNPDSTKLVEELIVSGREQVFRFKMD